MSATTRCADLSELAGESLGGTATTARTWLLVEVPGTWPRDVSDGDGLPEALGRSVRAWLERTPTSRLLFIRRPGRPRDGRDLAFVVHATETSRSVRRLEVVEVDDPDDLDEAGVDATVTPLVLVCGHGTRDACCALRGTAVYEVLAASLPAEQLWISSHQGGHRFAANVLVLPLGVHLGRVAAGEASELVARTLGGRIDLDRFRGRTMYSSAVQAADIAVRSAHGLDGIEDLHLVQVDGDVVRFSDSSGREHVAIAEERLGPVVPASCGAAAEPQRGFVARVV